MYACIYIICIYGMCIYMYVHMHICKIYMCYICVDIGIAFYLYPIVRKINLQSYEQQTIF